MTDISHRIIADLLTARTGQQLTEGRQWRIATALAGLFRKYGIDHVDQLVCLLADPNSDTLASEVVEALLNNETYFFRDRLLFEQLSNTVLPDLAQRRAGTRRLSIWSAGCSTGQEVLSLAMVFSERPDLWSGWSIDILGTDISAQAIAAARRARYSQFEIQRGLGVVQMLKHFHETENGWEPDPALLRNVRYRVGNVLAGDARPQTFDLVLCRNVLLYFNEATKTRAFEGIDRALRDDGWLMLGAGESVVGRTTSFVPATDVQGLFRCAKPPREAQFEPQLRGAAAR